MKQKLNNYWQANRRSFFTILGVMLLTLAFKIVETVQRTSDQRWRELNSPYDIRPEYQRFFICAGFRRQIAWLGWENDNFISEYLKAKQQGYYKLIKTKALPDDLVLDILELNMNFGPFLENYKNDDEFNKYIINNFSIFLTKPSKIGRTNKITRYEAIDAIVRYYQANPVLHKDPYYIDFFESKLRPYVEKENLILSTEGKLLMFTDYYDVITIKAIDKYKEDSKILCIDPDYLQEKWILKKARDFINTKEVDLLVKDKFYFSFINYLSVNAREILDEVDNKRCAAKLTES